MRLTQKELELIDNFLDKKAKPLVMSYKERQKFLKTSGLAKLFGVDHLLPEVNLDKMVKAFLKYMSKKSNIVTMKAQYKGRSKPLPYVLEKEDD